MKSFQEQIYKVLYFIAFVGFVYFLFAYELKIIFVGCSKQELLDKSEFYALYIIIMGCSFSWRWAVLYLIWGLIFVSIINMCLGVSVSSNPEHWWVITNAIISSIWMLTFFSLLFYKSLFLKFEWSKKLYLWLLPKEK